MCTIKKNHTSTDLRSDRSSGQNVAIVIALMLSHHTTDALRWNIWALWLNPHLNMAACKTAIALSTNCYKYIIRLS